MSHSALPYVAPFATFLIFLGVRSYLPFGPEWEYPARVLTVTTVLLLCSRRVVRLRPRRAATSVLIGVAVFVIWVCPDILWPRYRSHFVFQNSITGAVGSSVPDATRGNWWFILFRVAGTALLVPVLEELFWRAWLMRYLVASEFEKVELGTYSALSFWMTAALFASEHGPYWEVGLVAGIMYNWWMVRSRSLADCILAHGVTNALLAAFVLGTGRWEYWM
jgi:uncharacterized protein